MVYNVYNTKVYMKATKTLVDYGSMQLEVYMADDHSLYFSAPRLNDKLLFDTSHSNQTKYLKRLPVEGLTQVTLDVERTRTTGFPLELLPKVIVHFAKKGNAVATDLALDLVGLSLEQLAYDAFGVKFEKSERQAWMEKRLHSKVVRRSWTDVLKEYGLTHQIPINYGKYTAMFYNITGLHKGRDSYTQDELMLCVETEKFLDRKVGKGFSPDQALRLLKEYLA